MKATAKRVASYLLDEHGRMLPQHASFFDKFAPTDLRLFCHFYARYGLPTVELVDWLLDRIGGRSAIEIGAGCGDLGSQLGIPMTDNFCQSWPDVQLLYKATGQPTIQYGADVVAMDALEAVQHYAPEVVVGQWVTQFVAPDDDPTKYGGGSMYGVREVELLTRCKEYILIGSEAIHGKKFILQGGYEVERFDFPFLRSRRSSTVRDDAVWIIKGGAA